MKCKRIMASLAACVTVFSAMASQTAFASNKDIVTVELESGAERSSKVISANDSITVDGKELRVIATGLKEENKAAFLKAVEDNFSLENDKPVKIIDEAFVDSEKASVTSFLHESSLCWAASASNLLWLSDWAEHYKAPGSDVNFDSEDAVFDYYSEIFINKGSFIDQAINWFFMGTYVNEETGAIAFPVNSNDPSYGLDKSFVSSLAMEKYDLTKDPAAIAQIERTNRNCESPQVFQGSIGTLFDGELSASEHSITIDGIIIDPEAETLEDRYKGVIIIDSDNDGDSDEFEIDKEYPDEVRKASRESRPNSYTVYSLKLIELKSGGKCWEIAGYSDDKEYTYIIYDVTAFPLYDEAIIEEYTETEGTKKHYENPDLYIANAFTTSEDEVLEAPFEFVMADRTQTAFRQGEHININFFVGNKGTVSLDENYAEGNTFNVDWSVKNTETGEVAASGRQPFTGDIYAGVTVGKLINLNIENGETVSWEPGEYELTISLNPDRSITESYFLNNTDYTTNFTVYEGSSEGDSEEEETKDNDQDDSDIKGDDSKEDGTKDDGSNESDIKDDGDDNDDSSSKDSSDPDSDPASDNNTDGASKGDTSDNNSGDKTSAAKTSNPRTAGKTAAAAFMMLASVGAVCTRRKK